jgi:tetratricopeptide (TPR) repeat protein
MAELSLTDAQRAKVERLKAEGDGFFVQKKYRKAHFKYSEAIKLDHSNAVLYANRAASALSMKECVAISNVLREINFMDIDTLTLVQMLEKLSNSILCIQRRGPVSGRLHMRVIVHDGIPVTTHTNLQALGSYDESLAAFEKALSLISPKPSASEITLKKQCEEGLGSVRDTISMLCKQDNDSFARVPIGQVKPDEFPWNRAMTMMDELVATRNPDSSVCNDTDHDMELIKSLMFSIQAWVIKNAHQVCSLQRCRQLIALQSRNLQREWRL